MATKKEEVRTLLEAARAAIGVYVQQREALGRRKMEYSEEGFRNRETQLLNTHAVKIMELTNAAAGLVDKNRAELEEHYKEQEAAIYADPYLMTFITAIGNGAMPSEDNFMIVADRYKDNQAALTAIKNVLPSNLAAANLEIHLPSDFRKRTITNLAKISDGLKRIGREEIKTGAAGLVLMGYLDFLDMLSDDMEIAENVEV